MKFKYILILLIASFQLNSQTYCLELANPFVIESGTKLQLDIKIIAATTEFNLGGSNLVFNFNSSALSNPKLVSHSLPLANYNLPEIKNPSIGRASFNTVITTYGSGITIGTADATNLARITFDIAANQPQGTLNWIYSGGSTGTLVYTHSNNPVQKLLAQNMGSTCLQGLLNTPLPLDLVSFDAKPVSNNVKLTWITQNEVDFERFEIEKSSDAISFEKIGTVYPNQTRSTSREYTFLDDKIALGQQNYYRLKMIDNDQSFKYSKIVSEYFDNTYDVQVYPNPTKDFIYIKVLASDNAEPLRFTLYDIKNSLIMTSNLLHSETQIDISKVPVGEYFYRIEGKNYKNEGKLLFGR